MRNLKRFAALMMAAILIPALLVTAFAAVDDTGFTNVPSDGGYAQAVAWCKEHGLMQGTSSAHIYPPSSLPLACTARRGTWEAARAVCWAAWVACPTVLPECSAVLPAWEDPPPI